MRRPDRGTRRSRMERIEGSPPPSSSHPPVMGDGAAFRLSVGAHDVFESGHAAALDQRCVARAHRAQQGDSLVDTRHAPLAVESGLVSDHLDPELRRHEGDPAMLGLAVVPELGHQPEDRQLAFSRQRRQRAQGRLGRRRVRVVAVDDQDGARRARDGPPCARASPGSPPALRPRSRGGPRTTAPPSPRPARWRPGARRAPPAGPRSAPTATTGGTVPAGPGRV